MFLNRKVYIGHIGHASNERNFKPLLYAEHLNQSGFSHVFAVYSVPMAWYGSNIL